MSNRPSEQDRNLSAAVQLASGLTLFGAPWWVARLHKNRRSAFLSYWLRVSAIWSVIVAVLLVGCIVVAIRYGTWIPFVLTVVLHILACVMAALSAASNACFQYFFVGRLFCLDHLEAAWPDIIEYEDIDPDEPDEPGTPVSRPDRIAPPQSPRGPSSDEVREMYPE